MAEPFFGRHTIKGDDGSPYMSRYWIGRLRLHVFHRGDLDPDPHDHPWDFWTFPLTSYVEEVAVRYSDGLFGKHRQVVPALRLSFRAAAYCHRVLGRHWKGMAEHRLGHYVSATHGNLLESVGPAWRPGKIVTIVWRGKTFRKWGFLKHAGKRWCWEYWRDYLNGGKNAPCGEP